jgi:hypothetical protein
MTRSHVLPVGDFLLLILLDLVLQIPEVNYSQSSNVVTSQQVVTAIEELAVTPVPFRPSRENPQAEI